mgnify:CR=1 FL=1
MSARTFLLMAGGTGGHVYPALATARALQHYGDSVVWMGSKNGMEEDIVSAAGIPFNGLSIKGLRGKGKLSFALAPFRLLFSLVQALKVCLQLYTHLVLLLKFFQIRNPYLQLQTLLDVNLGQMAHL